MEHPMADIERNVRETRERINRAAELAGRNPNEITLVAVTKTVERPAVDHAYALGLRHFGENRVQAAQVKFAEPLPGDAVLHLIGHLQTNKAQPAVRLFHMIESVDRRSLIDALQHRAEVAQRLIDILIQVNIAGEIQKSGCPPEEATALVAHTLEQPNLRLRGLMTIAPLLNYAEDTRPVFQGLRLLRDRLWEEFPTADLQHLSMGMTNDFEIAIQEGATIVRIGRALFG
jgi:pyridoxal phosphate enzyme (YggS family)